MGTYSQETKDRANHILDGVVTISENDQLIHGEYVTSRIVKPELAAQGAICGGHQACLVGSVAIASLRRFDRANDAWLAIQAIRHGLHTDPTNYWFEDYEEERKYINRRPALKLAMTALNEAAEAILAAKRQTPKVRDARSHPTPAEGYFEVYLSGASKPKTHAAIVDLVEGARSRI